MNKNIIGIFVCMLLIATAVLPIAGTFKIELKNDKILPEENLEYASGELLVKFREGTTLSFSHDGTVVTIGLSSVDSLNKKFKVNDIKQTILSVIRPKNMELAKSIGLDRIYTLKVDEGVNILEACEAYKNNPHVEYAEPNYFGQGCVIPNDPSFNLQWGLHNTGQTGGTADADIDAPEAWDMEKGEAGVKIAIVDSGIDWNHQDLSNRIWINYGDPINGVDDDGNGYTDDYRGWDFVNSDNNPMDDHFNSHGTHCAGIAGAATNNNIGIAGVDWNCKLMAVKAMQSNNVIKWAVAAPALMYAADMGANIISMSWSDDDPSQTLKDAVDYAYGKGCVMVAATGNYGTSYPYIPSSYDNTIAVGATMDDDTRWSSSNYGNHLDLVAPGVDIYSTMRNNGYGYLSGTSMATPMVAGAAALLIAQDHTYTQTQIWAILTMTADDQVGDPSEDTPGFDIYHGNGRLNLYKALYGAPCKPWKPSGPPNGNVGTQYTYTTVAHDPNEDNVYYWWDWGDGTNSGWLGSYPSGQQVSASYTWTTEGTYSIKVKAKDTDGKESDWSEPLSVTMPKNKALINTLFLRFLERFPHAFPTLRNLLGL